ncbi:oocyte zinc finger protein XlCOF22-like [Dendropsophus ebraccatus]|uniref:oocyte zinc finger protein XlCOF22-like n=1 Tax=Dendropsophus ebraccatus TaxID=150705 RepID=UPI00383142AB
MSQEEDVDDMNSIDIIVKEEAYEWEEEQYIEDIPTDDCTRSSEGHQISSDFTAEDPITQDTYEEQSMIPYIALDFHSQDLQFDPFIHVPPSDSSLRKKPYSCSECGRRFTMKSNLLRHLRTHTQERPFSCLVCGKCCSQKSDLIRHQRIHIGEQPYPERGTHYSFQPYLFDHNRARRGEKPFSCSECGKRYSVKSTLVEHQRMHTGEKPFPCPLCGKCFTRKSNLVEHQKTHTGEKPFSCAVCGKRFNVKSNLVRHQRIHTGERLFSF